ncbi:T9SS type A sorting domain-containing protein [Lewinella lacunae]|uniref:T9SS type A sorting domain-containing protein n=2 Tax=Neolewinella lacunae TaxID=1517758 RepID=A0A923PRD3_9BACT|nr:T9SS type A sorting domain-containing protein [Neolewinella lacunae]MBC6996376.1 T9SS type A sorting domain-containing protein [Neolewinella lacunae]
MRGNNGRGSVPSKGILIDDRLAEAPHYLNRHANGEDWWVVSPLRDTNLYAVYLLDSTGIELYDIQQIGIEDSGFSRGGDQSVFSPQGDQFYRYCSCEGMQIFDFDRKTGQLSNFQFVEMPIIDRTPPFGNAGGVGISPSGRFAYVSTVYTIYQYDLWAADIAASRLTVGVLTNPNNNHPIFAPRAWNFQLGPDCKLYAYAHNTDAHHVIHYPDELGLASGWEQEAMQLPFPIFRDQPAFPNFRLGPLGKESSPCAAPIVSQREVVRQSRQAVVDIYPNPAGSYVRLALKPFSGLQEGTWRLIDAYGRTVKTIALRRDELVTLPREGLPAGVYFWQVISRGAVLDQGKLVWE